MNILDVSSITTALGFIPKKGTWVFLQDAYKDMFNQIMIGLIKERYGNFSSSTPYALYGCKSTNLGASTQFSDGAIFKGGEIFYAPTQIVSNPVGLDVFLIRIKTTPYTTFADPDSWTDGSPRNVHNIRTAEYFTGTSGSGSIGNFTSVKYPFEQPVEVTTGTTINGDTIDFTQTKTILYDVSVSATATPSLTLNLVNGIVGNKVRCIFAPSNSSSIAVTSITELGSVEVIDKVQGMFPTIACALCWIEYEFIGGNYVIRTVSGFNP